MQCQERPLQVHVELLQRPLRPIDDMSNTMLQCQEYQVHKATNHADWYEMQVRSIRKEKHLAIS